MSLAISVHHDARQTRVVVTGQATAGQMLSLLQVLQVDSATWPRGTLLFDLQGVRGCCVPPEQSALQAEAARLLPGRGVIAFRWPGAGVGD